MTTLRSPRELAAALDRLRERIEKVADAVADTELQERLTPFRNHLSTSSMMLRQPTDEILRRVADRVDEATRQWENFLKAPNAPRWKPLKR